MRQGGTILSILAYFDLYSGASGDMILGALVDAGLELDALREHLKALDIVGYDIRAERVRRGELTGTSVHVHTAEHATGRHLADILSLIDRSTLPSDVKESANRVFSALGEAESQVHGVPVEQVHFHEVGALDAIIDIVGTCLALHILNITDIHCSPFPLTHGTVRTVHGSLPVPAPATLELLARSQAPLAPPPPGARGELVTPTGAALLCTLATFSPPSMRVQHVGYGAGDKELAHPNLLRVLIGEAESVGVGETLETITMLETNIDDMSPQVYGYLVDRLLEARALDVYTTSVGMKKNRPGTMLSVICYPNDALPLAHIVLRETTTLGVRLNALFRVRADRAMEVVNTSLGPVRTKVKRIGGTVVMATPEYDDCVELAKQHNRALIDVMAMAARAAARRSRGTS